MTKVVNKKDLALRVVLVAKKCLNCENSISRIRGELCKGYVEYNVLKLKYKYTDMFLYSSWTESDKVFSMGLDDLEYVLDIFESDFKKLASIRKDLIDRKRLLGGF